MERLTNRRKALKLVKNWRAWLATLGTLLLLFVIGLLYLYYGIIKNPEKSVALVTDQLHQFFRDADIVIEQVEVSPFESKAIIRRLRIRETTPTLTTSGRGRFLDVRRVIVLFEPGSISQISEIRIEQPTLHITRNAKGQWNFDRILRPFKQISQARGGNVPIVRITEGRVVYHDPRVLLADRETSLKPIELRIDSPPNTGRIDFHGTFSEPGLGLTKVSGFLAENGSLDFNIEPVDRIILKHSHPLIDNMVPELRSKWRSLGASGGSIFGSVRFTGNHKKPGGALDIQLDLTLRGVTLAPGDLPGLVQSVSGRLVYKDGRFRTPQPLRARLAGISLVGRVQGEHLMIAPETPSQMIRLDPRLTRHLESLTGLPLDSQFEPDGALGIVVRIPLPGSEAPARVSIRNGWLRLRSLVGTIDDINGDLVLGKGKRLRLIGCRASYRGQPIYIEGWLEDPGGAREAMSIEASAPHLDLRTFPPPMIEGLHEQWIEARPTGGITLSASWRKAQGQPLRQRHQLTLREVALTHKKLRLSQINGVVTAGSDSLEIENLTTRLPEGLVRCTGGKIPFQKGPLSLDLALNKVELSDTLIGILPPETRKQARDLALAGWVSGQLRLTRNAAGQVEATGRVVPQPLMLRYKNTPIRITGGTVRLSARRITAEKLAAHVANSKLVIDGWLESKAQPHGELRVFFDPLGLDPSLSPLLPAKEMVTFVDAWPNARLTGEVRVSLRGAQRPHVKGQLRVLDGTVRPRDFPLTFHDVRGLIRLDGSRIEFVEVTGRSGKIRARVTGTVQGYSDGTEQVLLDMHATSVPFCQTTRQALEPRLRRIYDQYDPRGTVDLHLSLAKKRGGKMLPRFLRLMPRGNASMRFFEFPYPVDQLRGTLIFTRKKVLFQHLEGRAGTAKIVINGLIGNANPHDRIDIAIQAKGAQLDPLLGRCLPPRARKIWNTLRPSGRFDVNCRLLRSNPASPEISPVILFTPVQIGVRLKPFDYPLLITGGKVEVNKHLVHFKDLQAAHGKSQVMLSGKIRSVRRGELLPLALGLPLATAGMSAPSFLSNRLDLRITSKQFFIDQNLLQALSPYIGNKPSKFQLGGQIRNLKVQLEGYLTDKTRLDYRISGRLANCSLDPGIALNNIRLGFDGSGTISDQTHTGRGKIRGGQLSLARIRTTGLSLDWNIVDRYMTIQNLTGRIYGGQLVGRMTADLSKLGAFRARFRVENVDLTKLGKELLPKKELSGTFTAGIELEGLGGDSARLLGKGGAYIKDGYIWKLPLFLGLTEAFDLKSPAAFRTGAVEFTMHHKKLDFRKVVFQSSPIELRGKGQLDFGGNLDVTLTTWFAPETIPRIPIVDRLWRKVKRNVFPVKVTGSILNPDVSLRPFDFIQSKSPR